MNPDRVLAFSAKGCRPIVTSPPPPPLTAPGRQVRGVLSVGLHPAAAARPRLRRHLLHELPARRDVVDPDPHRFDGDHDG